MKSLESAILAKLDQLRNCVGRIEQKKPFSSEKLRSDFDLQDVVSLNLQRAIQICVDIGALVISETEERPPETMAETFSKLRGAGVIDADLEESLKKAVGLRNALVHQYSDIKWEVVFEVADRHLQVFRAYAAAVAKKTGVLKP